MFSPIPPTAAGGAGGGGGTAGSCTGGGGGGGEFGGASEGTCELVIVAATRKTHANPIAVPASSERGLWSETDLLLLFLGRASSR